ncbi:exopolysaccharide biosynthesis protein, partial [Lactobacillus reuteri]|nr:exopolysaccharide biosynthesis protein [Limosilactobacillus reuteri]
MERKKNRKKNIWVIIIPILIFIAFIGAGAYALRNSLIPTDHTRTNSSVQPTKTSVSNGYVEQKGVEAAVGSIALVDDAGVPKWVKVPSKVN